MSLKLQIIHASEFVRLTRKGGIDLEATKQGLAALARAACQVEDCQLLIDGRECVWKHSTVDIWELVTELEKHAVFARRKIAILASGTAEKQEFFKLCAQNRGYWVNVFRDFEEAVNWLFCATDLSAEIHQPR
jgi:hypothetical protein